MARTSRVIIGLLTLLVIGILAIGGYLVYWMSTQQAALGVQKCLSDSECPSGYKCVNEVCEKTIESTLKGKAATISVFAYDYASDTPSTSKLVLPLYLVESPIITTTKVSGTEFAADATDLSSTSRTDITKGIVVGDKVTAIAVNASGYGIWSAIIEISTQAVNLDLKSYSTAIAGAGDITVKDKDENIIADVGSAGTVASAYNLTLGASAEEQFNYIRVENNNTNTAWNVKGIFFDAPTGNNISSITGTGTTKGDYSTSYTKSSTTLQRTEADDYVIELSEPVLLLEYDYIQFENIQIKADGDGCGTELISVNVFDSNWFRSSKENAMILGIETDADSPVDVGVGDYSEYLTCTA